MYARLAVCLAATLMIAVTGSAGAAALQPNPGATPGDTAAGPDANVSTYNQAATDDPYNQSDFSNQQSFGLVASQMLGAAAACEQLHSDSITLGGLQAAKNAKPAGGDHADIDAAQQNMLDPAVSASGTLKGAVDCDRVGSAYSKLQQIQLHNQLLSKDLDQPGAHDSSDKQVPDARTH